MKRSFSLLSMIIAFIVSAGVIFVSCDNNNPDGGTITYKGRVVSLTGNKPLADITVRITNGTVVRTSMITAEDGVFRLRVVVSDVDDSYYLELLDKNGTSKKGQLRAFGMGEYDYGDIPFVDINQPPVVETIGLSAMTETSFTCRCNVVSQGDAIVTERGLCWATNVPTIKDNKVPFGSGMGEYSCTVANADINILYTTYYARAYAINQYGTSYGEPIEINSSLLAYFSLPSMAYGGYTYHIHPDIGGMTWEQGNDACNNLIAYGFDDWYLPNKEELGGLVEKAAVLQEDFDYWSSTKLDGAANQHYYWWCSDGRWRCSYVVDSHVLHVIPVRKDR